MIDCREGQQLYRVFRAGVSGWKLKCARDEAHAEKQVSKSTGAALVRPSSYWQHLRSIGAYPPPNMGRRRRR